MRPFDRFREFNCDRDSDLNRDWPLFDRNRDYERDSDLNRYYDRDFFINVTVNMSSNVTVIVSVTLVVTVTMSVIVTASDRDCERGCDSTGYRDSVLVWAWMRSWLYPWLSLCGLLWAWPNCDGIMSVIITVTMCVFVIVTVTLVVQVWLLQLCSISYDNDWVKNNEFTMIGNCVNLCHRGYHVGRIGAKCKTFLDYVHKAVGKLKLEKGKVNTYTPRFWFWVCIISGFSIAVDYIEFETAKIVHNVTLDVLCDTTRQILLVETRWQSIACSV